MGAAAHLQLAVVLLSCLALGTIGAQVGNKRPLSPEDLNSAEFRGARDAAAMAMNRASNSAEFHALASVQHATRQVVAGILYEFSANFVRTDCENREELLEENLLKCTADGAPVRYQCQFKVLYQPWSTDSTKYQMINEVGCSTPRMSRSGEKQPLTPEEEKSEEFQGALLAAQAEFNKGSFLSQHHAMLQHRHASKQLVAGILYEFIGVLAETKCDNNEENRNKDLEQCAPSGSSRQFECRYRILYQAWANTKYQVLNARNCAIKMV